MGESSMNKIRRNAITHKAWSLVRMALLWGRKGGLIKKWSFFQLRTLFSKHFKALLAHHHNNGDRYYGERQLSFNETPLFNVKKKLHRRAMSLRFLLLPCIAPPVDFEYDFEMEGQDYSGEVESYGYYGSCEGECNRAVKNDEEEEKGVDVRAEEFIAKFYEQIKLQREISFLEYKQHNHVVSL